MYVSVFKEVHKVEQLKKCILSANLLFCKLSQLLVNISSPFNYKPSFKVKEICFRLYELNRIYFLKTIVQQAKIQLQLQ